MNIIDPIKNRRAIRAFNPDRKISRDVLQRCVEAAHTAPSYANKQGWRWILVDQESSLLSLRASLTEGNYWARNAPVLAALITDEKWSPTAPDNRAYAPFGAGLSAMNFMIQASAEGLETHPMAGFDPLVAKEALGVPKEHICIVLIAVGYKGDESNLKEHHLAAEHAPRSRRPIEKILAWNEWKPELESDS